MLVTMESLKQVIKYPLTVVTAFTVSHFFFIPNSIFRTKNHCYVEKGEWFTKWEGCERENLYMFRSDHMACSLIHRDCNVSSQLPYKLVTVMSRHPLKSKRVNQRDEMKCLP